MVEPLPEVRRIVTGHTSDGRATIVADGPTPAVTRIEKRPGYVLRNMWRTHAAPDAVNRHDDIKEHSGVLPPAKGTVLRVIDMPPEPSDPAEVQRQYDGMFQTMFPDADHTGTASSGKHPGMHTTLTVDYAIVLEGEVTAILDDCETVMKAGDILIQRGTNHAWSNRSGKMCRIAFILVDAE